jgi:holo-[acyl-carrier protein] synthase
MQRSPETQPGPRTRGGVGIDVVEVAGLARRLAASPGLDAVLFSPRERAAASRRPEPARPLAACFAAKEAFVKALGRGFATGGPDAWLQQVELVRDEHGAAALALGPAPARHLARRGFAAAALAVAEGPEHAWVTVLLLPAAHREGERA